MYVFSLVGCMSLVYTEGAQTWTQQKENNTERRESFISVNDMQSLIHPASEYIHTKGAQTWMPQNENQHRMERESYSQTNTF
jgi:hypothetical protein